MRKTDQNDSFIFEKNNEIREEYIIELGKAVQNYIKTGLKRQQLEKLLDMKNAFRKKYNDYLNQYIDGDSITLSDYTSEEFKDNFYDFLDITLEFMKRKENKKQLFAEFEKLKELSDCDKFLFYLILEKNRLTLQ